MGEGGLDFRESLLLLTLFKKERKKVKHERAYLEL
jgi:hypothetical protein